MKQKKALLQNSLEVFSNKKYLFFSFFSFLFIGIIFYYFTEVELIRGNFGEAYLWIQILLQLFISILFAMFLPISVYKYVKFSNFSVKENSSSVFGTFLGVLVMGCPACSITLASYVGLAGLISILPFFGLELKVLALAFLLYANYSLLINLNACNVKKKQ